MLVTTTEKIPGREVKEVLGIVFGCCVQMKHIGKVMEEARRTAMQRMIDDGKKLGADAIICMRFATAQTMGSAAEIIAFGTAVKTH